MSSIKKLKFLAMTKKYKKNFNAYTLIKAVVLGIGSCFSGPEPTGEEINSILRKTNLQRTNGSLITIPWMDHKYLGTLKSHHVAKFLEGLKIS